ncbi:hypothetical protein ACS3SW_20655 [Roseobacteraceae bacterium S113]
MDDDDLELADEYPVFDRVTSTFTWHKVEPEPPSPKYTTYGLEIEGGMGYILNGVRVGSMPPEPNED